MKVADFENLQNHDLREIINLCYGDDRPMENKTYPLVSDYVNTENSQIGNYMTRRMRVVNLIQKVIFRRFMNNNMEKYEKRVD